MSNGAKGIVPGIKLMLFNVVTIGLPQKHCNNDRACFSVSVFDMGINNENLLNWTEIASEISYPP